ncbi:hypothetical protein ABZ949_02495 [Micromonospora tulbaghiae]|uniref:hypothetical protein n=1 Tax=Micromonospora tulbaghiae TaxID=479978 RepID=UPI0033E9A8A9
MITWEEIINVDPRMAELERLAVQAALTGVYPDRVYTDAKPYIGALVGWRRGQAPAVVKPNLLQQRYARAIAVVVVGRDDERLSSQTAYEVACGQIHDAAVSARQWMSA